MTSEQLLTFDDLEDILAEQECETRASEFQGMIIGLYSGGMPNDQKSWKSLVMGHLNEGKLYPSGIMDDLNNYVKNLGDILENDIFELELAMPPESASIEERLEGACEWAQGFLLGYGMIVGKRDVDSQDLSEALEDLMEISQVDLEVEETEEMEQALHTVLEHVRVTSQVVFLETRSMLMQADHQKPGQKDTIH
ncbi:UPF0149 family protein [Pleionea sediminis]|uniref:UPF0149 family protein n=1 Tax=Pleionea sediminis TaxID=2569479 RepID=UPI001186CFCF|nr:UPF0149 family protein [Pleionea sediminis]